MMTTLTPGGRATAVAALLVALAGAVLAIVLLREHLTVFQGDVAGGLFCGGSGRFDCNVVAASPAAWWLGLPVALWGLVFYIAMLVLAIDVLVLPPEEGAAAAAMGVVLALTAVVVDAYLAWLMVARIGAICVNCLTTYVLNVGLVAAFWKLDRSAAAPADWKAYATHVWPRPGKLITALAGIAAIVVAFTLTSRSVAETRADAIQEAVEFLNRVDTEKSIDMSRFDGRPSIGPADARVTIAVASDFECSFCRALAARLDALRAEHPRDVRVIFVNAPISSRCNPYIKFDTHEHACWLAKASLCAAEHGKFWEYHDLVYRDIALPDVNEATVRERMASIGIPRAALNRCIASAGADSTLARDARLWHELGMASVPSLVINGHVKSGGIYPITLRAIVNALLAPPS